MNCDECGLHLAEHNTHEHILCTQCMHARERLHCIRCHCATKWNHVYHWMTGLLTRQRKFFLVAVVIGFIIGSIGLKWPTVALKIMLGIIGLPLAIALLIGLALLLFPLTRIFGNKITNALGWDLNDHYDEVHDVANWAVGALCYAGPFIFYWAGTLIWWLIRR